jgi:hypothetical protein
MKGTTPRTWKLEALVPSAAAEALAAGGSKGLWRVDERTLPWPVFMRLGYDDRMEIVCTGLAIGLDADPAKRVTVVSLRKLPVQEILAEIVRRMRAPSRASEEVTRRGGVAFYGDKAPEAAWGYLVGMAPEVGRVQPGRPGLSDDYLRSLVKEYQQAVNEHPEAPTRTLARRRNPQLTTQAIRYQLRKAEERGLLKRRRTRNRKGGKR